MTAARSGAPSLPPKVLHFNAAAAEAIRMAASVANPSVIASA
jgi:hypothetical protein